MRREYILRLLEKNERIDGRKLDEFRKIEIEKDVIEKAEGSARVKIGKTEVLAGVKMDFGEPFPDIPDMGMLRVEAEFTPLASPDFESGPPGEDAIELARVVDRGIRESGMIDLEKLCIKEGEKVWSVSVDILMVNHHGNLIDAAALAAVSALKCAKLLKVDKDGNLVREEKEGELPLMHTPITVTVGKINGKLIVDPNVEEEEVLETKVTIGVREDGKVCAMQKSGVGSLTEEETKSIIDLAVKKSKEIRKLI